jgi:lipopolysaccharide transport protein LptA
MIKGVVWTLLIWATAVAASSAQNAGSPSPTVTPKKAEKTSSEKGAKEKGTENKLFGGPTASNSSEPITTEVFADEAFFDSSKSIGTFSGHVKVVDPRFNVQSDKLTIYISKGQNQGLEKAVAEGNVGVVRDRPDPNGGAPTRAVGRSDTATYIAATGSVELTGTPRVQQGLNVHVATSPDTVMVLNQDGQLSTHGPSRTDIRQEPKLETSPSASLSAKPEASPKKP